MLRCTVQICPGLVNFGQCITVQDDRVWKSRESQVVQPDLDPYSKVPASKNTYFFNIFQFQKIVLSFSLFFWKAIECMGSNNETNSS